MVYSLQKAKVPMRMIGGGNAGEAWIMKRCGNCQKLTASRNRYCPACGSPFPEAQDGPLDEDPLKPVFDFRDLDFPEEESPKESPRRPSLSGSSVRLLLCALLAVFLIAAILFAVLSRRAAAPAPTENEYGESESAAHVLLDGEDAPLPGAEASPVPVETPGRGGSSPLTTPYPAATPAPLPRS